MRHAMRERNTDKERMRERSIEIVRNADKRLRETEMQTG